MEFNNREIAVLVWSVIFFSGLLSVGLSKPTTRQAAGGVIRALLAPQILTAVSVMAIYIVASIKILGVLDVWQWSDLKITVVWVLVFALVTAFDINRITKENTFFSKTIREILSATVLIEFIAHFYAFSLPAELFLVPLVTIVAILHALCQSRPEFVIVRRLFDWVLSLLGLVYVGYSIYRISQNFDEFATLESLREFSLPILLSLLFLPFIYLLGIYTAYEKMFLQLNLLISDEQIRKYAKIRTALALKGDLKSLQRWARNVAIFRPANKDDVLRSIREIREIKRRERSPPVIPKSRGWSPYLAMKFLKEADLATGDYYRSLDGWYASSLHLDIGSEFLPDRIFYFVEGDEYAAKRLELTLDINTLDNAELSEERFYTLAHTLFEKAMSAELGNNLIESAFAAGSAGITSGSKKISLIREDWPGGDQERYTLKFVIENMMP